MSHNVSIGELFSIEKGLLQSSKCTPGEYNFITASSEWKTHNEFDHEGEYLIFAAAASGSLGRVHYVNGKFISSDLCYILKPKNPEKYSINMHFYHFVFNSLRSTLVADTKSGTSKESINQKNFKKYKLPYFDIDQQDFWFDKLINTLDIKNSFSDEVDIQQMLLKKLRQQILQDAIEGKLTKEWRDQNPDVEPASELLKRIQSEKEQLIKDKKIKKQKVLPVITHDEEAFELPNKWIWSRLGNVIDEIKGGGTPSKANPSYWGGDIPWASVKDLKSKDLTSTQDYISLDGLNDSSSNLIEKGNLIISTRMGLGKIAFNNIDVAINQDLKALYVNAINKKYFYYVYKTYDVIGSGMTVAGIRQDDLLKFLFPLPPLQEQKEIVNKVEKLLTICDQLESHITSSQANAEELMQSVLREAFRQEDRVA